MFLGISLTGNAPDSTSVFTTFKFSSSIDSYEYGTPTHWSRGEPFESGWEPYVKQHSLTEPKPINSYSKYTPKHRKKVVTKLFHLQHCCVDQLTTWSCLIFFHVFTN